MDTVPYTNRYPEDVAAPSILLLGPTATGKTHSIRTLVDAGVETFIQFLEPGFREVVGDISCEQGLHWSYIAPAAASWDMLLDSAKKINTMSYKTLADMTDINRQKYQQWFQIVGNMNNFHCDRCGKDFGDVETWGPDRAISIDGLTGLSQMAMALVVGNKPAKSPSDWGVAQDNLEAFTRKMTSSTRCWFIMMAHIERELEENTGVSQIMVSTLGRKLPPKIPFFFSDVINTKRVLGTGGKPVWKWSTLTPNTDLKARNVGWSDDINPDFKPVVETFFRKNGLELPVIGKPVEVPIVPK